jgi:hypothetical protein
MGGPQGRSGRGGKEKKIHSPRRESNPRTPIVQPVAQHYTDWAITALVYCYVYLKIMLRSLWLQPASFGFVSHKLVS